MTTSTSTTTRPLDASDRQRLARLIKEHGEREALRLLGVPRNLLARAAAGLPLRRGSILLLQSALAGIASTGTAA